METTTETTLPTFSEVELKKFETKISKADLQKLAADKKDLVIKDVNDKEGYNAVSSARKELKAKRVFIEKTGKAIRDEAVKFSKSVIEKEKELIAEIEPVELILAQREKTYEDEKERIKQEEENAKKAKIESRINQLRAVNFEIDYFKVAAMTDEQFENELKSATELFEAEKIRLAEVEKQKEIEAAAERERQEKIKSEQEAENLRLQKIREEQEEKERAFKAEQKRIADEQAERERKIREEQEKIKQERNKLRNLELRPYIVFIRDYNAILNSDEETYQKEFAGLQQAAKDQLEYDKAQNLKRIEEEEKEAERIRIEREEKEKEKIHLEKLEAERQEALRPDVEKIVDFANSLTSLKRPIVYQESSIKLIAAFEQDLHMLVNELKISTENL